MYNFIYISWCSLFCHCALCSNLQQRHTTWETGIFNAGTALTQRSIYAESTLDFSWYSQHCVQGPQGFMFARHEARASSSCRKNMAALKETVWTQCCFENLRVTRVSLIMFFATLIMAAFKNAGDARELMRQEALRQSVRQKHNQRRPIGIFLNTTFSDLSHNSKDGASDHQNPLEYHISCLFPTSN